MYEPRLFHWIDSGIHTAQPIEPLAYDEAIAKMMDQPGVFPIVHYWIYDRALFLGRRDAKLPRLAEALRSTASRGYGAVLRSSGGACVPLDAGVLNVALHVPNQNLSLDAFFRFAAAAIQTGLRRYGEIAFGAVSGSYCVGDYDFAIRGKKIGGMAQRRTKQGAILQLCINVAGSGRQRGDLMAQFYQIAGLAEMKEASRPIPDMDATTIGSLEELLGRPVAIEEVKQALLAAFSHFGKCEQVPFALPQAAIEQARAHLQNRLGLFSYTADQLQHPDWRLPD